MAVVTKPFQFEGAKRLRNAEAGIAELRKYADTLLVIPNENLFRIATDIEIVNGREVADVFGLFNAKRLKTSRNAEPGSSRTRCR